jgi:ribosomal protein RSM22 (predicted rRNA methylase)
MIPDVLRGAIERVVSTYRLPELKAAAEALTGTYHDARNAPRLTDPMRAVYLMVRFPATYAAVSAVLTELHLRAPAFEPKSILDLGTGPGTGLWAAADALPTAERLHGIERDQDFLRLGERLAGEGSLAAEFSAGDLATVPFPPADVVLASYSLGELPAAPRRAAIDRAWQATQGALVLIEPGTPAGFATILAAREQLLDLGAMLCGPCPHEESCPLALGEGGWCHFSQRLPRTREHRLLKDGSLGWEDEKYSYLIMTREAHPLPRARVLRHPIHAKSVIRFEACTRDGFEGLQINRHDREGWPAARKLRWGDAIG